MCCTCNIVEKEYLIQEFQQKLKNAKDAEQRRRIEKQLVLLDDAMMIHKIVCCRSTKKVPYMD